MSNDNIILLTDGYKPSHWLQIPPGTEFVCSYFESRGGKFDRTVFFGLDHIIETYLTGTLLTQKKIDQADALFRDYFGSDVIFNRQGWEYILSHHGGKLPIRIDAVPEGTPVNTHNVLIRVMNTDPRCGWLVNYLETILSQVWYPTTVATLSAYIRSDIERYLRETADDTLSLPWRLHDFGCRGVSSMESAAIGGAAHLVNFFGSDTLPAVRLIRDSFSYRPFSSNYLLAGSIPAAEHFTITSWGRENEVQAYRNMLEKFPTGLVAVVSDSYDIFHACSDLWGSELRDKVLSRDGTLVIRPDSGDPVSVTLSVADILGQRFGYTVNRKGFKELNPKVRIIQGDGVNRGSINAILENFKSNGWSASNITFGMGGGLLQQVDRDTCKFAFKCSAIVRNGEFVPVSKDPITDQGKKSKEGFPTLVWTDGDHFETRCLNYIPVSSAHPDVRNDALKMVFSDGCHWPSGDISAIRKRASAF